MLGLWRELNSIYKLQNKHILINFVYDYPFYELYDYSILVLSEIKKRNYKYDLKNIQEYFKINDTFILEDISNYINNFYIIKRLFENKMNDLYLRQCLYNLEEKAMCNGMKKDEWNAIYNKFGEKFDLWKWEK